MREALSRHVNNGVLIRVANGLYANPLARSRGAYPMEEIVSYLRPLHLNYLSAETVLSERGIISQLPQNYLSVMTSGKSYVYHTPYGTIDLTHTSRAPGEIRPHLYFDARRNIYIASIERAYGDLKRIGRSTALIDEEELAEQLAVERASQIEK